MKVAGVIKYRIIAGLADKTLDTRFLALIKKYKPITSIPILET